MSTDTGTLLTLTMSSIRRRTARKLGNEPAHLFVGSKLRIKYLPDKPKYVIPAK